MVCINKEALKLREYALFKRVSWSLSKTDIATILEVFEILLQSYNSKDIDSLYGDGNGHFVFLLTNGEEGSFDLYPFINEHYNEDIVIDCVSAKQLFPKNMSNGVYTIKTYTEVGDDATSNMEDEATGYIDENELQGIINSKYTLEYTKTGSVINLSDKEVSIGRSVKDADFVTYGSSNVSRCHCFVYTKYNKAYVRDNKSLNGTYINSKRLLKGEEKELCIGDTLYVADEKFVLR